MSLSRSLPQPRLIMLLWLTALMSPLVFVIVPDWVFWHATNQPERFLAQPSVVINSALLLAAPFVGLAIISHSILRRSSAVPSRVIALPLVVGLVVTIIASGLFYFDRYVGWHSDQGQRVNILVNLLMLFLPAIVALAMHQTYRILRRTQRAS